MDYPTYFSPAVPVYNQYGLPPTPSHTNSIPDDFSNPSPPDANYDFQFDTYNHNQHHFTPSALHKPPTPLAQPKSSISNPSNHDFPMDLQINTQHPPATQQPGSNSDDEDNMTPAQTRRKAQNRQAQRAFRERKERHVKDLEAKLASLEKNSASVAQENERLKLQLQKTIAENEILKITSANSNRRGSEPLPNAGPMRYSPKDFYTEVLVDHENKTPSHRIVTSESGEKLLAAGATWDYILKHDLFKRGLVDIGDVSDRLKHVAKCDGQGPVFEEREILSAIEKSVASGNDELL